MSGLRVAMALLAWGAPALAARGPTRAETEDELRAALPAALEAARARARTASPVVREITMPSIERLIQDADARAASITVPDRDRAFVVANLARARRYADAVATGDDPYRAETGTLVKAYRADWDGALQPYALYVPKHYTPGKPVPLIVALHGAFSDHRHNLRRVFGLDNRPGESDAEASRNELPLPDVPAIVVSPYGRGELMGYDGLGGADVMRVIADVRRAYDVDPEHITLTGLSMGGDGTWQIGLRHPEMFAALAPVCAAADFRRLVTPADAPLFDLDALDGQSAVALAPNAARMQVMFFHGDKDPVVSVNDSRKMADRFKQLGWLGKNVRYKEYPGVGHNAWVQAYANAGLLRALAAIKRDPAAPKVAPPPPPDCVAVPGLMGKSAPRQVPHIYVYGTRGAPDTVEAGRRLATAMADWGPMVGAKFTVKADRDVTAADRDQFALVLIGAAPFNALDEARAMPDGKPLGDRAFRALVPDRAHPGRCTLVLGATTPRGFDRLRRFARQNRDARGTEPNRPFVVLGTEADVERARSRQ